MGGVYFEYNTSVCFVRVPFLSKYEALFLVICFQKMLTKIDCEDAVGHCQVRHGIRAWKGLGGHGSTVGVGGCQYFETDLGLIQVFNMSWSRAYIPVAQFFVAFT